MLLKNAMVLIKYEYYKKYFSAIFWRVKEEIKFNASVKVADSKVSASNVDYALKIETTFKIFCFF